MVKTSHLKHAARRGKPDGLNAIRMLSEEMVFCRSPRTYLSKAAAPVLATASYWSWSPPLTPTAPRFLASILAGCHNQTAEGRAGSRLGLVLCDLGARGKGSIHPFDGDDRTLAIDDEHTDGGPALPPLRPR